MILAEIRSAHLGATYFPGVARLQVSLTRLAAVARLPSVNPGRTDGNLDSQTFGALAAAVAYLPKLPSYLKTAITVAAVAGTIYLPSDVRSIIENNADTIATAVDAAVVGYSLTKNVSAPQVPTGSSGGGAVVPGMPASFPQGTIQTEIRGKWHIAIPKGSHLSGLGESGFEGATHDEAIQSVSPAPGVTQVPKTTYNKAVGRFWTQWWFWAASAVAITAIVATPIIVITARRRRRRR